MSKKVSSESVVKDIGRRTKQEVLLRGEDPHSSGRPSWIEILSIHLA